MEAVLAPAKDNGHPPHILVAQSKRTQFLHLPKTTVYGHPPHTQPEGAWEVTRIWKDGRTTVVRATGPNYCAMNKLAAIRCGPCHHHFSHRHHPSVKVVSQTRDRTQQWACSSPLGTVSPCANQWSNATLCSSSAVATGEGLHWDPLYPRTALTAHVVRPAAASQPLAGSWASGRATQSR